ncbi:MAG: hypothetical protein QMD04_04885 [Anaerolineales bacterium]|nr:hypothetical protein [Anaerolineales bacterium]
MATTSVELTFDKLLAAVRKLPNPQKARLWYMLNTEFSRDEIQGRAIEAVEAIRAANEGVTEDEVMADATAAVQEVRAERRARSR